MVFHDLSYGQEVPIETMEEECSSSSREVSSPSSSYEDAEAESDGDDEYEAESGGDSFEEFDGTEGEETMIVEPYQYKPLLLPQSGESGQPVVVIAGKTKNSICSGHHISSSPQFGLRN